MRPKQPSSENLVLKLASMLIFSLTPGYCTPANPLHRLRVINLMVSASPFFAKMKNNIGAGNLVRALVALHDVDKNITTKMD